MLGTLTALPGDPAQFSALIWHLAATYNFSFKKMDTFLLVSVGTEHTSGYNTHTYMNAKHS